MKSKFGQDMEIILNSPSLCAVMGCMLKTYAPGHKEGQKLADAFLGMAAVHMKPMIAAAEKAVAEAK